MAPRIFPLLLWLLAGAALAQGEPHVAKADSDGVQRIRIVGGSYFFKPAHIVVKANVPVELLASRESGCSKKLPFIAGHREKGMQGVLEVVP